MTVSYYDISKVYSIYSNADTAVQQLSESNKRYQITFMSVTIRLFLQILCCPCRTFTTVWNTVGGRIIWPQTKYDKWPQTKGKPKISKEVTHNIKYLCNLICYNRDIYHHLWCHLTFGSLIYSGSRRRHRQNNILKIKTTKLPP